MSYSRSTIVTQAKAWIGCKESDGSHKKIIDVYNAHTPLARGYKVQYTDAWCATFVSACSIKCGYTAIIPTECSCSKMIELFKDLDAWQESDSHVPSAGDIMFYDWQDSGSGDNTGASDHVGIVEKVSGTTITVIEGNYSNAVNRRTMTVNGKYIRGYGVPNYDGASVTTTSKKLTVDGQWGKDTTSMSQKVLGTSVDGIVSNQPMTCKQYLPNANTLSWQFKSSGYSVGSSLIKAIQKLVGAEVDGHCGKETIACMQAFLIKCGIDIGTADGLLGPKTVKGWQTYINSKL